MAQGMPRRMPFLPASADPNNLLCVSFCVGTKQPSSVHSNVCKQLLPLISTVMLSKHAFPPAATSTASCGQTPLNPICRLWGGSQAPGSLPCLPARLVGIEPSPLSAGGCTLFSGPYRTHESMRQVQRSPLPEPAPVATPKEQRAGWAAHLPRQGGQRKTLKLSPLLAKEGQARCVTRR